MLKHLLILKWPLLVVIHNVIVHPLLPIAEFLDRGLPNFSKYLANKIFYLHDITVPEGGG